MIHAVLLLTTLLLSPQPYLQVSPGPPIEQLFRQARRQLTQGLYKQAREAANEALKIDSRSAEALSLLGQAEFALGDLPSAEQHLTQALRIEPALPDAHRALGATFLRMRRFSSAEAQFEAVLRSHPDDESCLYGLGFSLLGQNKLSQALNPLVHAYHLNPSDPAVLTGLLEVYVRLGQQNKAAPILAELNRQMANDYSQQMQLAEVLVREGAYDLAVNQFQLLMKARPGSYELNYDLALAYHRAGKDDQAAAQLHKMLQQKDSAELQNLLGAVEEKLGRLPQALAAYRQAASLEPGNEDYRLDYATVIALHGNPAEAVKVFAEAVQSFPRSARMWTGLGGSYYLTGKYNEAASALLRASQIDPDSSNVYALLGSAYDAAGPLQKEIAPRFVEYVKTHPGDAIAHYYYGKILLDQEKEGAGNSLHLAQQEFAKAIALNPSLPQARLELGKLLLKSGDLPGALTQLEATVKLDPESSDAYYQLMGVYRKLGQEQKAALALQKFHELKDQSQKNANRNKVMTVLGSDRQ